VFISTDVKANTTQEPPTSTSTFHPSNSSFSSSPLRKAAPPVPPVPVFRVKPIRALDVFQRMELEITWRKLEDAFVPSIQSVCVNRSSSNSNSNSNNTSTNRNVNSNVNSNSSGNSTDSCRGLHLSSSSCETVAQQRISRPFSLLDEYLRLGVTLPLTSTEQQDVILPLPLPLPLSLPASAAASYGPHLPVPPVSTSTSTSYSKTNGATVEQNNDILANTNSDETLTSQSKKSLQRSPPASTSTFSSSSSLQTTASPRGPSLPITNLSAPFSAPPSSLLPSSSLPRVSSSSSNSSKPYPYHFQSKWRISSVNQSYQLCPSYPRLLVVPTAISDTHLQAGSKQRSIQRIPALTWIHPDNGAALCRYLPPYFLLFTIC
jgi:hypothetical protein